MQLTRVEREKITDTVLKIQSASSVLEDFDGSKIPAVEGVQNCLKDADKTLRLALRIDPAKRST
jgi:hypothetical protein